jgi:hypothetical protein
LADDAVQRRQSSLRLSRDGIAHVEPPGRQNLGVPVIDITDPNNPMTTAHLASTSMLDPVGIAQGK